MNYEIGIIKEFASKMEMFEHLYPVLLELAGGDNNRSMKELASDLKITGYPFDKTVLALEFAGLVEYKIVKSKKIYNITEDGRSVIEFMEGKNV